MVPEVYSSSAVSWAVRVAQAPATAAGYGQLLAWARAHPEVMAINAGIVQKAT